MASILEGMGGSTMSLLSLARNFAAPGIGLSANARALNESYLSQSSNGLNTILSANVGGTNQIQRAQMQILAIRGSLQEDQVAPSLRGTEVDEEV